MRLLPAKLVLISLVTASIGLFQQASDAAATAQLMVTVNGQGAVSGTPATIACSTGSCSYSFATGTSITLVAVPAAGSSFAGWLGGSCTGANSCSLTLTGDTTMSATFVEGPAKVRIQGTPSRYYPTLQTALDHAANGEVLRAAGGVFHEDILLTNPALLNLQGGYNSSFENRDSVSLLDGTLTIAGGSLTVSGLTIASGISATQPMANAGSDRLSFPSWPVQLDGTGSRDAGSNPLSYSWDLAVKPQGSSAVLSGATTANPAFTPDLPGLYVARLIVNNGQLDSTADTATVTVQQVTAPYSASSLFSQPEAAAVTDSPNTFYTAEQQAAVLQAAIKTFNTAYTGGVYTFDLVNQDTDPNDTWEPEVSAHFLADDYPDDGVTANATLRLRGNSSRLAVQKSYRVKLSKDASSVQRYWRNETTLQLNKHPWDLARVRNKLAFDLFRDIPHLPSLRTQFMQITIDDENNSNDGDYGLFTHVEKVGKEYLSNRGLATDGNIYKANNFTFRMEDGLTLGSDGKKPLDKAAFELILEIENVNTDHRPLIAMINAVNNDSSSINDTIATYFDRNNYITWLATNILAGNRDTITQNFELYQPAAGIRFYFIPWDYDGAFGFENQPDIQAAGNLYAPWQMGIGNWWGVPLHNRFLMDATNRADLTRTVLDIYSTYLTPERIKALLDSYRPLVQPLITRSPDLDHLPTVAGADSEEQWAHEYARLVTVTKINLDRYLASLNQPMPFWQSATVEGSTLVLAWDPAVDLQGGAVTYDIQIASDPAFSTVIHSTSTYSDTSLTIAKPAAGTYYLRVIARNAAGLTTTGFDRHDTEGTTYWGVLQFTVS